jgi:hypothetical protein
VKAGAGERTWKKNDTRQLIRLLKTYGREEVVAKATRVPLDLFRQVKLLGMSLEDQELQKRFDELRVKYKDEPSPSYRAADELFEEIFGRKPTWPEEVEKFRGRLKKRRQRYRARVGPDPYPGTIRDLTKRPPLKS